MPPFQSKNLQRENGGCAASGSTRRAFATAWLRIPNEASSMVPAEAWRDPNLFH
jgi:hypothetical protein